MTWSLHRQQQQCGAQLPNKARQAGEVPRAAGADRAAQDHEQAGEVLQPGDYPASPIDDKHQDNTPGAPEPQVQWDEVVQPERRQQQGETELEEDQRGDDAEQVPDPQAEQALREAAIERDSDEWDDEAGGLDRND
jgi:hypothetical protein